MRQTNQKGFTIIEITLAMAFIATLLMAVMTVGMQLISLYNKGLTIKDVNTVARLTVRDMQDSVAQSASAIKLAAPGAASVQTLELASGADLDYFNNDQGGRLCTGSYTYIWNYQEAFTDYTPSPTGEHGSTQFIGHADGTFEPIRFVKVEDESRELCNYDNANPILQERNLGTRVPDEFASKLQSVFGEGDRNLVLYSFEITSPESLAFRTSNQNDADPTSNAVNTNIFSSFYTFKLVVGSSLFTSEYIVDDTCTPSSGDSYAEYCAINQIDFVARTGQY